MGLGELGEAFVIFGVGTVYKRGIKKNCISDAYVSGYYYYYGVLLMYFLIFAWRTVILHYSLNLVL